MADSNPHQTAGEKTEKMCWQCGRTFTTAMDVCPDDGARLIETDVQDREDPLLGSVFDGRFRIYGKLGEGGMGAVYSARRLDFETDVALKLLKLDFTNDEGIRKRFMYEARVISNLSHPHAIQVFDFGQTNDGHVYMVMELLEGESLADRLAYRFVSYEEIFDIIPPICGVLGEAHTRDVVHRDLKPENIFLLEVDGNEEFPKLLDFGIAKHNRAETMTKSGTLWGTPAYMSPEQAGGVSVGAPADIYGIGIMLFELITGNLPFNASTQMGYAVKHINEPVRAPSSIPGLSSIPDELDEFIVEMLAKDADDRPESMEEVATTLGRIRDEHFDEQLLDSIPAREVDPIGLQGWLDEAPDSSQELPAEGSADSQQAGRDDGIGTADTAALATADTGAIQSDDVSGQQPTLAGSPPVPTSREMDVSQVETRAFNKHTEQLTPTDDVDEQETEAYEPVDESDSPDGGDRNFIGKLVGGGLAVVLIAGALVLLFVDDQPEQPRDIVDDADSISAEVDEGEGQQEVDGGVSEEESDGPEYQRAAPAAATHAFTVNLRALSIVQDIDPGEIEDELDEDFNFLHGTPEEATDEDQSGMDEADERQRLREALEETF